MEKIAVYPGSFDPITCGHLDVIRRSAKIFDKVYVSILENSQKTPLFSIKERMELIRRSTKDIKNIEITSFSGLLVSYMHQLGATVIVKGLRAVSDFEYEFQMALTNSKLNADIETLFMMTSSQYSYLSSSIVKEVATLGGSIQDLVPECVERDIYEKIKMQNK